MPLGSNVLRKWKNSPFEYTNGLSFIWTPLDILISFSDSGIFCPRFWTVIQFSVYVLTRSLRHPTYSLDFSRTSPVDLLDFLIPYSDILAKDTTRTLDDGLPFRTTSQDSLVIPTLPSIFLHFTTVFLLLLSDRVSLTFTRTDPRFSFYFVCSFVRFCRCVALRFKVRTLLNSS